MFSGHAAVPGGNTHLGRVDRHAARIPTTPLYERLKEAGRLKEDDAANRYGTNVIPLGISPEELRAGFIKVMQESRRDRGGCLPP